MLITVEIPISHYFNKVALYKPQIRVGEMLQDENWLQETIIVT